jgi:hypothetical protein
MAAMPELVGPPGGFISTLCPAKIQTPGGKSIGTAIPVRALSLGSLLDRNATSFPTGGSGTANAMEANRRREAGLQFAPRVFDPSQRERPSVFAAERSSASPNWQYQHLPLKTVGRAYSPNAMIFAQATSATRGQIASLAMTLPSKPAAPAKLAITWSRPCGRSPLYIYAPKMSAALLHQLTVGSSCGWGNLAGCSRAQRPRGQVLFVQLQRSGVGYEHRWVDYDLLGLQ